MSESEQITLTRGDPLYSAYIWRQDSLTLTRLRPILEEIIVMADTPCLNGGETCLDENGMTRGEELCLACELKQIRARLYGYRNRPPKEASDG